MVIEKIDTNNYREIKIKRLIDLRVLKQELKNLKSSPIIPRPTNRELLAWAEENHPYIYSNDDRLDNIKRLTNKISELERL